jgi:hypothetical protein
MSTRPWPCWRMRAGRRGDRVELIIGPGSSGAVLPRAGRLLLVPALVDRAASSGVVPGEPSSAAVLGAGSGFAEGAHHRFGAGAAASAASQHNHAWIVPHPSRANSSRPGHTPRRSGSLWSRRVGCRLPGPPLLWCWSRGLGWAGWAWPEGLGPTGADALSGRHPPGQPRSMGRSRGAGVPRARAARPSIRAREVAWL